MEKEMKTINLEEMLKNQCKITYEHEGVTRYFTSFERSIIIKAMKEACEQTLELAAENADIYIPDGAYMDNYVNPDRIEIDKSSILNTINQIK